MTDFTDGERELAKWLELKDIELHQPYKDKGYVTNEERKRMWCLLARELRGRQWQEMHCQLGLLREKINMIGVIVCELCEEQVDEIISEMQVELKSQYIKEEKK